MAARSIWNGSLRCGRIALPIKLYAAVEERKVRFHLLEARTKVRLEQRMIDPGNETEVPLAEARRGVEIEPGVFVLVEPDELPKAPAAGKREIVITRFVESRKIDPARYERPYYVGPASEPSRYFALVEALERAAKSGIARFTMRNKTYVAALAASGGFLTLTTLRFAGEVIAVTELPAPAGREPSRGERSMAEKLVLALAGKFEPEEFRDEYRARLQELVEAKARGRKFRFEREPREKRPQRLEQALSASLARMKERRSA